MVCVVYCVHKTEVFAYMSKNIAIKDAIYEKLNLGKFNNSFSDVIETLIKDNENMHREIGLLKQEIGLLKLRNNTNGV